MKKFDSTVEFDFGQQLRACVELTRAALGNEIIISNSDPEFMMQRTENLLRVSRILSQTSKSLRDHAKSTRDQAQATRNLRPGNAQTA